MASRVRASRTMHFLLYFILFLLPLSLPPLSIPPVLSSHSLLLSFSRPLFSLSFSVSGAYYQCHHLHVVKNVWWNVSSTVNRLADCNHFLRRSAFLPLLFSLFPSAPFIILDNPPNPPTPQQTKPANKPTSPTPFCLLAGAHLPACLLS